MPDCDYWFLRPVVEKMCTMGEINSGAVDLLDIARMNDALDVKAENQARFEDAVRAQDE